MKLDLFVYGLIASDMLRIYENRLWEVPIQKHWCTGALKWGPTNYISYPKKLNFFAEVRMNGLEPIVFFLGPKAIFF